VKEEGLVHDACKWCYRGVWGVLTKYFALPTEPPHLPSLEGEHVEYLRPSLAYLHYRKFLFWIGLFAIDVVLIILWIAYSVWWPLGGLITAPIWLVVIVVPDIIAYIAIHLRYDTTWYVLSDRSMRIRRGIWSIYETTITFENIQNANITQGPLQRWFGFANLLVMTAGGGGGAPGHEGTLAGSHVGILEGIDKPVQLRERILAKSQKHAGLGDVVPTPSSLTAMEITKGLNQEQISLLREIRIHTDSLVKEDRSR
jgi:membrane protein YdbS with pleckstrin-like domain